MTDQITAVEDNSYDLLVVEELNTTVIVQDFTVTQLLTDAPEILVVSSPGERGPVGPVGPAGELYTYEQVTPAATWIITHGFSHLVHVTIFSTAGEIVYADVEQQSPYNVVSVMFSEPTAGKAYLS